MEAVRALAWTYANTERKRDEVLGYAVLTETELLLFALRGKDTPTVSRIGGRSDLPLSQVEAVVELFERDKAMNPYRFKRSELRAIGYIPAAGKLRIETQDQTLDIGDFPLPSELTYIATEVATTVFPEIEPHREKVEANLSVQGTHIKAIGSVVAASVGLLILALIGGQDDFDTNARGSGIARMLGGIPMPVLLVAMAVAVAYPTLLMVRQARQGYVMRVWLLDQD